MSFRLAKIALLN